MSQKNFFTKPPKEIPLSHIFGDAKQARLNDCLVLIKLLSDRIKESEELKQHFAKELRISKRILDDNIIENR